MDNKINYKILHGLAMVYVCTLLVSNTVAVKIVHLFGLSLPAGIICFPVAYIFGDVLTEIYGYRRARSIIWWGFFCLGLMSLFYWIAVKLPPASFWSDQEAFARLFGLVPRITFASLVAYLIGSFLNAAVMSKLKVKTKGRHLWLRTISSTILGEGVDSIVFNIVAFLGVFPFPQVLFIAFSGFLLKTLYEIAATPLTYAAVAVLKRIEHGDVYDRDISYNPFVRS